MDLCKSYIIGLSVILLLAFLVILFAGRRIGLKLDVFFSDILKEADHGKAKWSQGRVYLFLSLVFYFFVLTFMSIKAVKLNSEIKNESFELVISGLQWAIALFAGYVFGAKGLKVLDNIFKYKMGTKKDGTDPTSLGGNYTSEQSTNDGQNI